jgi:hypothetical protein
MSTLLQDPLATVEPNTAQLEASLSKLKDQLKAGQQISGYHIVDTDLGQMEVRDLFREVQRMTEMLALSNLQAQRAVDDVKSENLVAYVGPNGERKWREKNAPNPPLLNAEKLESLFGLKKLAELSPEHRALARDLRESDLQSFNIFELFGKGSSSVKASALMASNPAAYRILQSRARAAGMI